MEDGTKKDLKVLAISFGVYFALLIVGTLLLGALFWISDTYPIVEDGLIILGLVYYAGLAIYLIVRWMKRKHNITSKFK